jgi:hypothetical protein
LLFEQLSTRITQIASSHLLKAEQILNTRCTEVVFALLCVHALVIKVLLKDPPLRSIRAHIRYTGSNPLACEQGNVILELADVAAELNPQVYLLPACCSSVAETSQKFYLFPELAAELRIKIWKFAAE